ncbi:MAG: chemotaxis protein CheA [Gammaproteobacteria bacterium]|nr:chemotaxis protein CheA [Gammaproteobacteria bacterium]MBQ0840516.1 chemotaxis protein CheA [Gammaproteobacteria bacterium]
MSLDEGLQGFLVESKDLLDEMEDLLLQLEEKRGDSDIVNALFRVVHTLKGTSGMFGFEDVVTFTHGAESVMDGVRDGDISLDDTLLSVLLSSRDHISTLLDVALGITATISQEAMQQGATLTSSLLSYLKGGSVPTDLAVMEPDPVVSTASNRSTTTPISDDQRLENECWHISLRFGMDVLRNGMEPMSFIRYLNTIGQIVSLETIDELLPEPAKMDAESCYLGFEINFSSSADKAEITSVFEFVQDDCKVNILPPHSHASIYLQLLEDLPEGHYRIGEILTRTGILTQRELKNILAIQADRQDDVDAEEGPVPFVGELAVSEGLVEAPVLDAAIKRQEECKVVRVSAEKLEELITLVGELVIAGANTHLLARESEQNTLIDATEKLGGLVEAIRDTSLSLRMVQIGDTFSRFRRVVRENSRELGKEIDLEISGGETELDKVVVDKMSDPLMHLVRNSIDHGLETPEEREGVGKPRRGKIKLNAFHDSGSIVIEIVDDGRGLSKDKIVTKALEKGLIKENHNLSDEEIYRLIFEAGFSTAESVTNLSGRGVGMDVVRQNIDSLRGLIDINSEAGSGTTISIRLPLTMAIIDGFLVQVGKGSYVVPLDMVDECVEYNEVAHEAYDGSQHINLRGEIMPYLHLGDVFRGQGEKSAGVGGGEKARENIVVARYGNKKAGLVVDELLGEHQTVIKPLGRIFENIQGLSGATILGNGEVAMIIDVPNLVEKLASSTM